MKFNSLRQTSFIFVFMKLQNTPISVWHGQPFEVSLLERENQWAIVWYRNPKEKPGRFSLLRNLFLLNSGKAFSAVGNGKCTQIKFWIFQNKFSLPKRKQLELSVCVLKKKEIPKVETLSKAPNLDQENIRQLNNRIISSKQLTTRTILTPILTAIEINTLDFQPEPVLDLPELKTWKENS
jgi:hypothetical protein